MSKYLWLLVCIALGVSAAPTQEKLKLERSVTLRSQQEPATVPDGRIWVVEALSPYKSETGVGTADLYIDGQVWIGANRDLNIAGKFDVLINVRQQFPIAILERSKVRVGDSRQRLTVKEFSRQ